MAKHLNFPQIAIQNYHIALQGWKLKYVLEVPCLQRNLCLFVDWIVRCLNNYTAKVSLLFSIWPVILP